MKLQKSKLVAVFSLLFILFVDFLWKLSSDFGSVDEQSDVAVKVLKKKKFSGSGDVFIRNEIKKNLLTKRISSPSWRPPEVFAEAMQPADIKKFPRGVNGERRFHTSETRELIVPAGDTVPLPLAKSPTDDRFHLLAEEIDEHTLFARRMVFDPQSLEKVISGQSNRILAPSVSDEIVVVELKSVKTRDFNTHTLHGHVVGEEGTSTVQFVYHDGVIQGNVARYDRNQELEYRIMPDGHMMVREIDQFAMTAFCGDPGGSSASAGCKSCGSCGSCESKKQIMSEALSDQLLDQLSDQGVQVEVEKRAPEGDTVAWDTIDVVVGYGQDARSAQGGTSQIEALIIASVDRMNQAFSNSLITNKEVMLLGTIEDPDYIFSGSNSGSMSDELGGLGSANDGVLDAVSDYSTLLGADLTAFVPRSADGSAGLASRPGNFSITARTYMTATRLTFAHELGHNLGCDHSWGDSSQNQDSSHYGWRLDFDGSDSTTNDRVRTIMAYDWGWGSGVRIPYFANPAVNYSGAPTGAPNGHDVRTDTRGDQRYYQNGLEYTNGTIGFDGSNPGLGARNFDTINTGNGVGSYGATYASNRNTRTSFNVTSPGVSAIWSRGTTQTISYTGGDMEDTATIDLYKGGVLQTPSLATNLNPVTDRDFAWSIPSNQALGNDYMIRVTLNRNGSTEVADSGTFSIIPDAPWVTDSFPSVSQVVTGSLSEVRITFSNEMDPTSFSVSNDVVAFTGPGGANLKPSISNAVWSSGNTLLTLSLPAQSTPGSYQLTLASSIQDSSGRLMNQDLDTSFGEANEDRYGITFSLQAPSSLVSTFPYTEGFESGFGSWVQPTSDTLDWTRDSGGTPSSDTGPSGGQGGSSWYVYTEASNGNDGKRAELTCWLDLRSKNSAEITFHYHMYGSDMGSLSLLASGGKGTADTLWELSDDQGNAWSSATVDLSAYLGQYVQLTFRGDTGSFWASDMAIDNIALVAADSPAQPGKFTFSTENYTANEADGTATITVNRYDGSLGAVSVDYSTSDVSATAGVDYTATSGTLNWADGDDTPKTFTVTINDDSSYEPSQETVTLTLSNPSGGSISGINPASLNINDNDNQPPVANAGQNQTVELGNSWSPSELLLQAWYDANDASTITESSGSISEWRDKSGNNRHATQSTAANSPITGSNTMGGLNVVTLNGSSQFLNTNLDYLAQTSHSAFIVTKATTYTDIYGAANPSAGANSLHVGFNNSSNYRMNYWGNDWNGSIGSTFNTSGGNVLNYVWTQGTSKQIFANGTSQGSSNSAGTIGTMSGGGRIGKVVNHGHYGGDLAEIIFITGALSSDDREKMEGYLAHKWGLEDSLPAAHPYKSSGPGGASGNEAQVNLDGGITGGSPSLTASWSRIAGPGQVTFGDVNAIDTTATFTLPGTYVLRFTVIDGALESSDDITITVGAPNAASVDFSSAPIQVYDPGQDGGGVATTHDSGGELRIVGNGWKRIAFPYDVTEDTILEFEFRSDVQGEIQGIGFDNDNSISGASATCFQLYGTQTWGIQNHRDYSGSGWETYRIRVGDYFKGSFSHLVFPMDHDGGARNGESFFRNVKVLEDATGGESVNFSLEPVLVYDSRQDGGATATVHEAGKELFIKGNGWKRIALPYNVTADTILEFEFKSAVQGEIHGIGFDNDDRTTSATNFQLYGTENYGISAYKNYSGSSWKSYRIRVGDYFTGAFSHLVFPMDHDGGARNGESHYKNIRVYEEGQVEDILSFASSEISPYDSRQDGGAVASVHSQGSELRVKGNGWKKIKLPYNVTPDTILEFDFKSGVQGEIHGIGFDDNDYTSAATNFQLYGTSSYGISAFKNYAGTDWKSYQIRVGDYFTGSFAYLVFPMDHDGGARDGESYFRNIRIYEEGQADDVVDFASSEITAYDSRQDGGAVASVHTRGEELRINGNGWKKIELPYTVTANTILEFEFRSGAQGEIHGIGFDNDDLTTSATNFQLYGTQTYGILNYKNYTGTSWKSYQIRVGDYFTGSFTYLVFPMDHDGGSRNGESYFRNVKVYEDTIMSDSLFATEQDSSIGRASSDEGTAASGVTGSVVNVSGAASNTDLKKVEEIVIPRGYDVVFDMELGVYKVTYERPLNYLDQGYTYRVLGSENAEGVWEAVEGVQPGVKQLNAETEEVSYEIPLILGFHQFKIESNDPDVDVDGKGL